MTCLKCVIYESNVFYAFVKMKWSPCMKELFSHITYFWILYLNWFCKPCQSLFIGLRDSYHNLASPNNVRQNLWNFTPSWNWCVFIQLFILSRCASASSSGFPENSGLKDDQFKCGIFCTCCTGCCGTWGGWRCWDIWCWWSCICHAYFMLCTLIMHNIFITYLFFLSLYFKFTCKRFL